MIYCIWYPSGGFGHWVNAIISLYGKNFQQAAKQLTFSENGNSHDLPLIIKTYSNKTKDQFILPPTNQDLNYTLLIDNGIDDESNDFKDMIPNCKIIKICYDDYTWPVIAQTCIIKAMQKTLEEEFSVDKSWNCIVNWSQREKYFLTLRDHFYRHNWHSQQDCYCINLNDLVTYDCTTQKIQSFGIQLNDFLDLWQSWWNLNQRYFEPIIVSRRVVDAIKKDHVMDLSTIDDIWTQAVIYYYLWLEFKREIPHNDYADFFLDTQQIKQCLKL